MFVATLPSVLLAVFTIMSRNFGSSALPVFADIGPTLT
jgi:hypothetical protein